MAIVYSRKIDPKTGDIKPRISKSDIEGTDSQGLSVPLVIGVNRLTISVKKHKKFPK